DHRFDRARAADHRTAAARRTQDPGHAHGGKLHPDAVGARRHRHAGFRPAARLARSSHPLRPRIGPMSTIPFGEDKALPDRTIETEIDASEAAIDRTAYEGQWSLMWRKFTRHKLGVAGGVVVIVLYIIAAMPEFFSPTGPEVYHPSYTY